VTRTQPPRPPRSGKLAAWRSRIEEERTALVARLRDAREHSVFLDAAARTVQYDNEIGGGLMAGALAFRLFLFMVPFALVVFTLAGSTAEVAASSPEQMARRAGISGVLVKAIVTTNSLTTTHQVVLLLVGGYALFMAARSVIAALVTAYCLAWRLPPIKVKRTRAALVFIAFITTASVLTSYLARLREAAPAPGLALTIAWLLLPIVTWWWASTRLPHGDAPVWALLPGAVVFGVGMQLLHLFTVYYITRSVSAKSETYGTIGISLGALAWAYVAGRLMISTAVVNAALWRRFTDNHPDEIAATGDGQHDGRSHLHHVVTWARSAAGLLR
jgi:uncharacterized BrkB/YihY/UPF0761 family membrane protein